MLPRSGKGLSKKYTDTNVYHPSIYSFKCRGVYRLSSEDLIREGVCNGLRTRLELLADIEPGTRESAIKNFTYMTDYDMDESDASSLNQKTKSILVSPAIIYKEQGTEAAKQSTPLLEEELIKRQKWSCYGSTEVDMLILKNEKDGTEHIAAVAPRNVGLSIRKIETDDGNISSIGIGWVNIVVDTGPLMEDPDEQHGRNSAAPTASPESLKNAQQKGSTKGDDTNDNLLSPATPEVPPKPSPASIQGAKSHLLNVYEFSLKVGEQMKHNVTWLSGTLQDDFPARCWSAGNKIVAEMPRTATRTASYIGKMYDRWLNGGGDENGP
jgi:hypothetical protein